MAVLPVFCVRGPAQRVATLPNHPSTSAPTLSIDFAWVLLLLLAGLTMLWAALN